MAPTKTIPFFYILYSKGYLTTFSATPDVFEEKINNHEDGRQIIEALVCGSYSSFTFPIIFHQVDGKIFRDFLDMRLYSAYLVSSRVKELLEENNISGWKTYPILLFDRNNKAILDYHGFSVTGRGGTFSIIGNNYKYDVSQWDGSDFFIVDNRTIVITETVMRLLKRNKISALNFIPLQEKFTIF